MTNPEISAHSPLPWSRNIPPVARYPIIFSGRNNHVLQLKIPAGMTEAQAEANCDYLLLAVNSHYALVEENKRLREALDRIILAAKILQQNSEGCAVNHYGHDAEAHGLPGWLSDTRADIEAAEHARAALKLAGE